MTGWELDRLEHGERVADWQLLERQEVAGVLVTAWWWALAGYRVHAVIAARGRRAN